ncbi:MAG: RluA family pseudouridine synthase [Myxococcales bacterium]|nr:RluA family pseudouridine synthase [Myxococcales bacterium]
MPDRRPIEVVQLGVAPEHGGLRLDAFLCSQIEGMSRARAANHLTQGHVRLLAGPANAKIKASLHVHKSMVFEVCLQPRPQLSALPEAIDLTIVYEDEHLLVVDKPAGLVVHPALGHESGTLVNALLHHEPQMAGLGDQYRPGLVHRIDRYTSGLLVVAKTDAALRRLGADFAKHQLERRYVAIALGNLRDDTLTARGLHARHPTDRKKFTCRAADGKQAVTHLTVLARSPLTTLVVATLETGRTHQIRVHLAELGHPIVGDDTYGGRRPHPKTERTLHDAGVLAQVPRQALHAYALGFTHPHSGQPLRFELGWPTDLVEIAQSLFGDAAKLPSLDQAVFRG